MIGAARRLKFQLECTAHQFTHAACSRPSKEIQKRGSYIPSAGRCAFFGDRTRQPLPESEVIREDILTVEVESIGSYGLMWTPTDAPPGAVGYTHEDGVLADGGTPEAFALAAGYLFTEGIVDSLADIATMSICVERPDVVNVKLAHPEAATVRRRNVVINSSCGVCGGREQLLSVQTSASAATDELRLSVTDFAAIRSELAARQHIFGRTGGAHGAALFGADGKVIVCAEDIERHNALDKVIGWRLLTRLGFAGCGAFLSSRASYEMTAKVVRAGLEVLATISAPTSLAIELAARSDVTLCGFVRGDKATVYTHARRIPA